MMRIYAKGVFDILHYGHIRFLKHAKELGDHLTIAVSPDERATRLKRPPVNNVHARAEVIGSVRYVDEVIKDGPKLITREFMQENRFDLYVFGSANSLERQVRIDDCLDLPPEMVVEIPYSHEISTTMLIKFFTGPENK